MVGWGTEDRSSRRRPVRRQITGVSLQHWIHIVLSVKTTFHGFSSTVHPLYISGITEIYGCLYYKRNYIWFTFFSGIAGCTIEHRLAAWNWNISSATINKQMRFHGVNSERYTWTVNIQRIQTKTGRTLKWIWSFIKLRLCIQVLPVCCIFQQVQNQIDIPSHHRMISLVFSCVNIFSTFGVQIMTKV